MENENLKPIEKLTPFTKMIMTIGTLPSSFYASMSYYESMIWLYEYLKNEVIPAVNNNAEAVEELQTAFITLKTWIENYFDNLDVQEEINTKLDEMAEDGSLTNLIKAYVDPIYQAYESEMNSAFEGLSSTTANRLLNQDLDIANFKGTVNNQIAQIDNKVDNATSGSPKGVYATVTALTTADPNHNYIYLVSADGKWYYYNTSTTSWTAGGVYQSSGFDENSIGYTALASDLKAELEPLSLEKPEYTVDDTIYIGSVNSTISTQSASGWKSGSKEVNETNTIIIPMYPNLSQTTQPLLFLTDENDEIIESYKQTDMSTSIITNKEPLIINIPHNVTKIYFNLPPVQTGIYSEWFPYIIKAYNNNDKRITNFLGNKITLTPTIINNTIYSLYFWNYTLSSYRTNEYNVKPLQKINVVSKLPQSGNYPAGFFVDNNYSVVGIIPIYGESGHYVEVDTDVIVPANATKLLISYYQYETAPVVSYYSLTDVITPQPKITVSLNDGTLTMTNLINNNSIEMKNHGGNNLFMISKYTINGETKNISTDMIPAPYIVNAVNNPTGDRTNEGFTGGNHQWNNQASGSTPTATQQSLYIYADNNAISNGTNSLLCNEITIIETNRVQANNTCLQAGGGRNVLEEKIIYKYDGESLKVKNIITPLEDITIKIYYGIQSSGFNNIDYKVFADKIYDVNSVNNTPTKPDAIYGSNLLCAKLYNTGLGDYRYNHGYKALISNNKSYYTPIYFNSQSFTTSDINYIEGEYIFDSNQI